MTKQEFKALINFTRRCIDKGGYICIGLTKYNEYYKDMYKTNIKRSKKARCMFEKLMCPIENKYVNDSYFGVPWERINRNKRHVALEFFYQHCLTHKLYKDF